MATSSYASAPPPTPSLTVQQSTKWDAAALSPLLNLIPFVYAAFSLIVSLLSFLLAIVKLALSPLPIILYIIAPITTFIDVTTTVFLRLPYRTFLYLADALYPLYVLLGVACITGCLFGYGGRLLVGALVNAIAGAPPIGPSKRVEERKKNIKSRGRQEVKFEE